MWQHFRGAGHLDEIQDINLRAWEIVKMLQGENTKLIILGDVQQKAYSFLGAMDDVFESAKN